MAKKSGVGPSIRRYGVAVDKGIYVTLLLCRFPGEQRYVNLGVHFGKHGALILTSRSYLCQRSNETQAGKQGSCEKQQGKINQARKNAQQAAKAAVLGSQR